jgi:hypothetical protein
VEPVVTSLVTEETSSAAQVYKSSLIEVFGRYFTVLGEILLSFLALGNILAIFIDLGNYFRFWALLMT